MRFNRRPSLQTRGYSSCMGATQLMVTLMCPVSISMAGFSNFHMRFGLPSPALICSEPSAVSFFGLKRGGTIGLDCEYLIPTEEHLSGMIALLLGGRCAGLLPFLFSSTFMMSFDKSMGLHGDIMSP